VDWPDLAWSAILPVVVSLLLSGGLILRGQFLVDGEVFFSLFDDALISMRYARNLVEGHGLVWNPGEPPVEGYTNLLWTLWMALLHLPGVPESKISLLVRLSGATLVALNLLAVGTVARMLAPGRRTVLYGAVWLTVFSFATLFWGISGLEVGLVTLLTTAAAGLALRLERGDSRWALPLLAVVLSLALLTRPDTLALCAVVLLYAGLTAPAERRGPVLLALGGAVAVTLLGLVAFRLLYYGDPLPNTYYLKLQGADLPTRLTRGLIALGSVGVNLLYLPVALALAYFGFERPRQAGPYLLAGLVVGHCAYSAYAGGDAWEFYPYPNRYITPVLPLLFVLAALGIEALVAASLRVGRWRALLFLVGSVPLFLLLHALVRLAERRHPTLRALSLDDPVWTTARVVVLVVAAVLLALSIAAWRGSPWTLARRLAWPGLAVLLLVFANGQAFASRVSDRGGTNSNAARMARFGLGLRATTAPEATIAVVWAGAVPYFSDRPAVDLLGKSDPVIAHGRRRDALYPGHDKWDYRYSIGQLRPDLIAQLWQQERDPDVRLLERWGYSPVHARLAADLYVRDDSTLVDRAALRSWVCRRANRPPDC
jgi:hypothetical protein